MTSADATLLVVGPARMVAINLASSCIGISPRAIQHKIAKGIWIEGKQYHRAPDGRTYVDLKGFETWVSGEDHGTKRNGRRAA